MSLKNTVAMILLALVVLSLPLHASDLKSDILAQENKVWRAPSLGLILIRKRFKR